MTRWFGRRLFCRARIVYQRAAPRQSRSIDIAILIKRHGRAASSRNDASHRAQKRRRRTSARPASVAAARQRRARIARAHHEVGRASGVTLRAIAFFARIAPRVIAEQRDGIWAPSMFQSDGRWCGGFRRVVRGHVGAIARCGKRARGMTAARCSCARTVTAHAALLRGAARINDLKGLTLRAAPPRSGTAISCWEKCFASLPVVMPRRSAERGLRYVIRSDGWYVGRDGIMVHFLRTFAHLRCTRCCCCAAASRTRSRSSAILAATKSGGVAQKQHKRIARIIASSRASSLPAIASHVRCCRQLAGHLLQRNIALLPHRAAANHQDGLAADRALCCTVRLA